MFRSGIDFLTQIFFYDRPVLQSFRIFGAGLVTAMLSACQNKLSGLLHCEQNGPAMDGLTVLNTLGFRLW